MAQTPIDQAARHARAMRRVLVGVSVALGAVILAPVALSSQDLVAWGRTGLGLPAGWAVLVPVALDLAAVACILMVIAAAWRRERGGVFSILVWIFAGVSAAAQYRHGMQVRATAPDAHLAFPAFAVLGPLLLEVTLHRVRKWARQDSGQTMHGAAGFGARWLPGVALKETLAAWAASRREGIDGAAEAVAYVRERKALAGLAGADALRYAFRALGSYDVHSAETWLQARGVRVDQAAIDEATAGRPMFAPAAGNPISPAPGGAAGLTIEDMHREALAACRTNRQRIRYAFSVQGHYGQADARAWLAERGYTVSRADVNTLARQGASGALTGPTGSNPTVSGGTSAGIGNN